MSAGAAAAAVTVLGRLLLAGGPHGAPAPRGAGWPIYASAGGRVVEHVTTGPSGTFRLSLAPGSYEIFARQPFAPGRVCDARALSFEQPRAEVHVQLTCNVK